MISLSFFINYNYLPTIIGGNVLPDRKSNFQLACPFISLTRAGKLFFIEGQHHLMKILMLFEVNLLHN